MFQFNSCIQNLEDDASDLQWLSSCFPPKWAGKSSSDDDAQKAPNPWFIWAIIPLLKNWAGPQGFYKQCSHPSRSLKIPMLLPCNQNSTEFCDPDAAFSLFFFILPSVMLLVVFRSALQLMCWGERDELQNSGGSFKTKSQKWLSCKKNLKTRNKSMLEGLVSYQVKLWKEITWSYCTQQASRFVDR